MAKITEAQIKRVCELFANELRTRNLSDHFIQRILDTDLKIPDWEVDYRWVNKDNPVPRSGLSKYLADTLTKFEASARGLYRIYTDVNPVTGTLSEAIKATGYKFYAENGSLDMMPQTQHSPQTLIFSEVCMVKTHEQLEEEYDKAHLVPVDPRHLVEVFGRREDLHTHLFDSVTHWRGSDGKWRYLEFGRESSDWKEESELLRCKSGFDLNPHSGFSGWIAGVRGS